jgi:hypothetical protein
MDHTLEVEIGDKTLLCKLYYGDQVDNTSRVVIDVLYDKLIAILQKSNSSNYYRLANMALKTY